MDFLNTFLSVPANRAIIKIVLVVIGVIVALVAISAFLSGYTERILGSLILVMLIRVIQAEVNHVEMMGKK